MSTLAWVLVIVAGWLLLGTALGLGIARVIRYRERQRPRKDPS